MREWIVRLWDDDRGALIATEWVFVATILVLGSITGLVAVRQAAMAELYDVANALGGGAQSYSFSGQSNCESSTAGSSFKETGDSLLIKSTAATPGGFDNRACD
jgi:hypothetical protein